MAMAMAMAMVTDTVMDIMRRIKRIQVRFGNESNLNLKLKLIESSQASS